MDPPESDLFEDLLQLHSSPCSVSFLDRNGGDEPLALTLLQAQHLLCSPQQTRLDFFWIPWSYKCVARSSQRPTKRLGKFALEINPLVLKSYQKNLPVCCNSFSHLYRLLLSWVVTYTMFHSVCLVVALFVQKRSHFPLLFGFILILPFVWCWCREVHLCN